ncbi:MAG: phage portal protein [Ruminococcus sp.]|nr:phage portal protein [Ruminococcus sp.]
MSEKEKYLMWTAYQPAFTTWNGALYESALIRASIGARARNISKLKLEIYGSVQSTLKTALKRNPNPLQTWSQIFARAITVLDNDNNCFILPWYDGNKVIGHLPVPASLCQLRLVEGEIYLVYTPINGSEPMSAEFSEVGILTQYQYKSDLFGASNKALTDTMELLNLQKQAIDEAVKNSAVYRFMAKFTEAAFSDDLADERKNFTKNNLTVQDGNEGLLLFPNSYAEIKQLENNQYVLDAEQTAQIRENVFNYFGVNDKILRNEAYGNDWFAFYEGAIEPFALQFSEVYERMLFTDLERSNGNGIMLASNYLEHMPIEQKATNAYEAVDRGIISLNEARAEVWGLPPVEGGDVRAIRGEYKSTANL